MPQLMVLLASAIMALYAIDSAKAQSGRTRISTSCVQIADMDTYKNNCPHDIYFVTAFMVERYWTNTAMRPVALGQTSYGMLSGDYRGPYYFMACPKTDIDSGQNTICANAMRCLGNRGMFNPQPFSSFEALAGSCNAVNLLTKVR